MPLYRYQCENCKFEFEKMLSIKAACHPHPACPACLSEDTRKLIARTSFSLKGDGWYKDGYVKGTE